MSSISWTLLRVCMRSRHFAGGEGTGGTSGSSSVEQGRLNRRGTGTCYCTMKNSSTCFNRPVFVCSFVCTWPRRPGVEHKAKSSDGSRAENPCADRDGPYPYPHPCVYVCASFCATTVCLFVGEERYRPLK